MSERQHITRRRRLQEVQRRIGARKLIWYGTRGTDSHVLLQLPQFTEVFSLIAPLDSVSIGLEVCLEVLKQRRVDLDAYRIANDFSREASEFQARLFESLRVPAVVVTYRSDPLFTSLYYPSADFVEYLGLFHGRQAPFEHKVWVETELQKWGIPIVPRRYLRDGDVEILREMLEHGPVVVRATYSDGGEGLALIREPDEIEKRMPAHTDRFFSVSDYLVPNIPLNVNAVVFEDGTLSLHSPSIQLIGIRGFTNRTFGYCGNDFARVKDLGREILDALEDLTLKVGKWLAHMGYLGAFGIDALFYEGQVYLTEINPRFQGSSHIASLLDVEMDRSDMFLEHIAAFLGLSPPPPVHLREIAVNQRGVSQVICHNCRDVAVRRNSREWNGEELPGLELMLLPGKDIMVEPQAILFRALIDGTVTDGWVSQEGSTIDPAYYKGLQQVIDRLFSLPTSEPSASK